MAIHAMSQAQSESTDKVGGKFGNIYAEKFVNSNQNYSENVQTLQDGGQSVWIRPSTGSSLARTEEQLEANAVQLTVFPNPAQTLFSVQTKIEIVKESLQLTLLNALGKPVKTLLNVGANAETKIEVGDLTNGSYFYVLKDGNKVIRSGKLEIVK